MSGVTTNSCGGGCGDEENLGSPENPHKITAGITFRVNVKVKTSTGAPFNLTGWTGRSQLRKLAQDTGDPVATFRVTVTDAVGGVAEVWLGATESLTIPAGNYVFDVEFEKDIDPDEVIPGSGLQHACVVPGVTK